MTPTEHNQIIDLAIMKALASCGGLSMKNENLIQQARLFATPEPHVSEMKRRIKSLDSRGLLKCRQGDYTEQYSLTEEGKDWWAEHGE